MNPEELALPGLTHCEPLIFERSRKGREGYSFAFRELPETEVSIPEELLRKEDAELPEVTEVDVIRHYTRLSRLNYGVDTGFYPLGSCTMKYNPKVNEDLASLGGFTGLHPYLPSSHVQGALNLIYLLERFLCEISGMSAVTLQPAAGAHGELTGLKIIRHAIKSRGERRDVVLIPDSAHGTNPASCSLNDFKVLQVKSSPEGILEPAEVEKLMNENVAAIMVTNPNTLGLFETKLTEISRIVHSNGGFVYGDGANLNALMGKVKPASMGIDVIQFNLHKTFSTPHGGGGPGSGPVGVVQELEKFLPVPRVVFEKGRYELKRDFPESIGRVKSFYGHFSVFVKAYAYIRELGAEGLKKVSEIAVLNANYLRASLAEDYHLPYPEICMHECIITDKRQNKLGVTTMDIAKRLMDYGFHPSTIYFPLIVSGALMIEPTETESKETLDSFIAAMKSIAKDTIENPQIVTEAPHITSVSRPDEVEAARRPVLRWKKPSK